MPDRLKVAFLMPNMELGGSEKSLISLLNALEGEPLQITLLLFRKEGALLSAVPPFVTVEELPHGGTLDRVRAAVSGALKRAGLRRIFRGLKKGYHKFGNFSGGGKAMASASPAFDVLVAYKDGAATWYAARIPAKKKIAFVHTDLKKAGYDPAAEEKAYRHFEKIYCVSEACRKGFLCLLPQFAGKTAVMHTPVDPEHIRLLSRQGDSFADGFSGIRLLTIGRLSPEKGLCKAVSVLAGLKEAGYPVRWYIIGGGEEALPLLKQAARERVQDDFVLLGEKENPYPYLLDCDIYVQPSDYESYCLALAEARAVCKPVVACDFSGAREQIRDGETGLVVGMDVPNLLNGIIRYLKEDCLRQNVIRNLRQEAPDFSQELREFTRALGLK